MGKAIQLIGKKMMEFTTDFKNDLQISMKFMNDTVSKETLRKELVIPAIMSWLNIIKISVF